MDKNKESFEEEIDNLRNILNELESGDLPLNESLKKFEEGISLYSSCIETLEDAKEKISILKIKKDGFEEEDFNL